MHVVTDPATMATEYDFIVVGGMSGPSPSPPLNTTNSPGGTAGCVVAGRLAENPNVKVLVIEAGITNPGDVDAITTPARAFELRDSKYDWSYKTTMIDRPEYTRIEKPNTRGKTLGGSSCLNYYTWIPGSAATFDEWADFGGEEWTWTTLQSYFYKPATYHDDAKLHSPELKYIGESGPIPVSHLDLIPEMAPFRDALTEAWISKGEPLTDDVHNGTMRGLWKAVNSIHAGKRSSSWLYLVDKPNVTVLGHTIASRLVFAPGSTTATGITALLPDNNTALTFTPRRELILSLGVFEIPKLLLLSGIGPGPAGTFLPPPPRRPQPPLPPHPPARLQAPPQPRPRPHPPARRPAPRRRHLPVPVEGHGRARLGAARARRAAAHRRAPGEGPGVRGGQGGQRRAVPVRAAGAAAL